MGAPRIVPGRCARCAVRYTRIAVVANVLLGVFKLGTGAVAGSMAVMVDGVQSLACAVVGAFIAAGMRIARRPSTKRYPRGYGKVEYLVSIASYSGLFGLALFILGSSIYLLAVGRSTPPRIIALPVSLISVYANYLLYRACHCAGRATNSAGLIANAAQNRADMLSSGAVAASVTVSFLGPSLYFFDALGAGVAATMIMYEAAVHWWADIAVLTDRAVPAGLLRRAERCAARVDGVHGTRFTRGRRVGRGIVIELGILVPPETPIGAAHARTTAARAEILGDLPTVEEARVYAYAARGGSR